MIRLATPVFDKQGNKRGIVVVNYLAKYLMEGMALFNLDMGTNYMLLNKDGYFFLTSKTETQNLRLCIPIGNKRPSTMLTLN